MNSGSLDSDSRALPRASRLIAAIKWCAIVVGIIQLLLAGLHGWILIDLNSFGTQLTWFASSFAAMFVALQLAVLFVASNLQRDVRMGLWFLMAAYLLGLVILGVLRLPDDLRTWLIQPGAKLPPNEIMGRGWPLAVAMMAFGLAQLLGIMPLVLVVLGLMKGTRSCSSAE